MVASCINSHLKDPYPEIKLEKVHSFYKVWCEGIQVDKNGNKIENKNRARAHSLASLSPRSPPGFATPTKNRSSLNLSTLDDGRNSRDKATKLKRTSFSSSVSNLSENNSKEDCKNISF